MPNNIHTNSQKQRATQKKVLSAGHNQLQQLIISQTHILEQIVQLELDQNPALEIATEPMDDEDKPIDGVDSEDWNQDYDKPYDEYETGKSIDVSENFDPFEYDIAGNLERVAFEILRDDQDSLDSVLNQINVYRINGHWPDDGENRLSEDFKILQASMTHSNIPTSKPTFEVTVLEDIVHVNVIPTAGDYLRHRKGFGQYSIAAKKFFQRINDRTLFLNYSASCVLENIQVDFFRQNDLSSALLHLLPIQAKNISDLDLKDLNLNFSFKLDKKLISKMSDLTVKCDFGIFPFGFFLPSKLVLLKQWVRHANDNGITTIKSQCDWIKEKLYERLNKWDSEDPRRWKIKSLLDTNESDIKNARRQLLRDL